MRTTSLASSGPRRRRLQPAPTAPVGPRSIRRSPSVLPSLGPTSAALPFIRTGRGSPEKKPRRRYPSGRVAAGVSNERQRAARPQPSRLTTDQHPLHPETHPTKEIPRWTAHGRDDDATRHGRPGTPAIASGGSPAAMGSPAPTPPPGPETRSVVPGGPSAFVPPHGPHASSISADDSGRPTRGKRPGVSPSLLDTLKRRIAA